MPKITYGIPSLFFQFFTLSPLSYLVMLTGKLLGTTDVMLLFKITLLSEEIFFIISAYFLIKALFKDRWTATAISLAAIISMESYSNVFFNLRIIYFLPLALLLLWHFVEQKDPKFFWMMLLVGVLGAMGNSIYMPIVTYYTLAVITVVLCTAKKIKPSLFWPRDALTKLTAGVTGALVLTYGLVMLKSFTDLSLTIRDTHAQNSMDVFLTHGGTMDLGQLFSQLFFMGDLYSPLGSGCDNTLYVGMLTGLFLMTALIYCRDLFFRSILIGLVFILLFSLGGLSTRLFYFLPGMSLYRHIGLAAPLIKVLVLIGAGFGLKYLFEQKKQATRLTMIPLMIWFIMMEGQQGWHMALGHPLKLVPAIFFLLFIGFYWSKPWDGRVKTVILLVLIIEAVVFQNLLRQSYPKVDPFLPDMVEVFTHVRPTHFDTTRLDSPRDLRWLMTTMVQKTGRGRNYVTMFNTLDFDTCHTDTTVQVVNKAVLNTWEKSQDNQEMNYQKIAGCNGMPKCALLRQLPLIPGGDVYQFIMPLEAEASYFDPDKVIFKVSAVAQPGWFYYADAFDPGWKALVDGVPAKIQQTVDGFKAVPVGIQTRSVEFHFFDAATACLQYLLCFGAITGMGLLVLRIFV